MTGQARVNRLGEAQLRSDLDLAGPDGRLLARLTGWANHRVGLPEPIARLSRSPHDAFLSAPWTALTAQLPGPLSCCRIDDLQLSAHGRIWERALARMVLSRDERAAWSCLYGSDRHRGEWLLGRAAAKDAVRSLLLSTFGLTLCPADVEIVEGPDGTLQAEGPWTQAAPVVSLQTIDGAAVAVAGLCHRIGVAHRRIPADGIDHGPEDPLVGELGESLRAEWALRLRCADEAAAALASAGATGLVAAHLDTTTGTVLLADGSGRHTVQTARHGDRVAALAVR